MAAEIEMRVIDPEQLQLEAELGADTASSETSDSPSRDDEKTVKAAASIFLPDEAGLATMLAISFGAVLGTLTRHNSEALFSDLTSGDVSTGGAIIFPDLPANMWGCFVMGVVAGLAPHIKSVNAQLFTGVGTGYCGCTTTFSSWINAVAKIVVGNYYAATSPDAKDIQVVKAWMALFVGFSCAVACLELGYSFARFLLGLFDETDMAALGGLRTKARKLESGLSPGTSVSALAEHAESIAATLRGKVLLFTVPKAGILGGEPSVVTPKVMMLASTLGAAFTILLLGFVQGWGDEMTMAAFLAPCGALLRWKLGKHNKGGAAFPWFTFLANMLGACVSTTCFVLANSTDGGASVLSDWGAGEFARTFLSSIVLGFAGSLTTVSTFVNEYRGLQAHSFGSAYLYAAATMLCGLSLSVCIMVVYFETYA